MNKKTLPVVLLGGGLVVIAALAGAIVFGKGQMGKGGFVEQKMMEQAVMQNCKHDQDFCKYMAGMGAAYQNGLIMTSEYSDETGAIQKSKTSQDGKGNMEMIGYSADKETSHMIVLDGTMYTKDYDDNTWIEFPKSESSESPATGFDLNNYKSEMEKWSEDEDNFMVKKVGSEKCGNLNCDIFEMTMLDDNPSKVWVDTKDHLARKMEFIMGKSKSVIIYEYQTVTITRPAPVKQMPGISEMMKASGTSGGTETEFDAAQIEELMKNLPTQE